MKLLRLFQLLILSTLFWLFALELLIFCSSTTFINLLELFQIPYKERVSDYDIGLRSHRWDDDRIARLLGQQIRVHCLVYMDRSDYKFGAQKAMHVRNSWGRRCNRLTIISKRNVTLVEAYRQIYVDFHNQFDWLLVVYFDSYVIMENLRFLLAHYSPSQEIYFSAQHEVQIYAHVGQVSTTDYIFSGEALVQLATRNCLQNEIFLRECLRRMKKAPSEALLSFNVPDELIPYTLRNNFWLWPCAFRAAYENQSLDSCFGGAILFPYCSAMQMYTLEFSLYHLRPYGHVNPLPELSSSSFPMTIASRPLNDRLARYMYRSVRIICLVLSWPKTYMSGVKAVSETWGRHCNRVVYYAGSSQTTLSGVEIVGLNVSDARGNLWGKTKAAFHHAYKNYGHEAEWFYKADDDTYAIMENMRKMLKPYSPHNPIYFGSPFKLRSNLYMSGGAGYVLSKKAVKILVRGAAKNCRPGDQGTEDLDMGICLRLLNVRFGDSRDIFGRHRFFSLSLEHFLIPDRDDEDFWLKEYLYQTIGTGMECCSTYSISIHNVSPYQMHFFETILYKNRPYGLIAGHPPSRSSRKKAAV
ncbi:glycoprotein-N-acetylgalactosamine 3-beta-galactosyltransferase 1 [Drosophila takahashii]|uniref:glycoprotein-N-acetylgalactosamine 3-beta-galactosyltransferase 1 n=1 Tax=Drosophila takahashii TaxID=29030 RepID=UPI0038990570